MKFRNLDFWIPTALFGLAMLGSGAANVARPPELLQNLAALGYPAFLPLILGPLKILGALAVLAPGLPRLKEWAYAGFAFLVYGGVFSHFAAGDPPNKALPLLVLGGLAFVSWLRRPADRRLGVLQFPGAQAESKAPLGQTA